MSADNNNSKERLRIGMANKLNSDTNRRSKASISINLDLEQFDLLESASKYKEELRRKYLNLKIESQNKSK